jgi:F-type H+-transporting ATPase subunit delta
MRDVSIARNYAEALLALAEKAKDAEGWGVLVSALGDAVGEDETLQRFLEAPQVSAGEKNVVLGKALEAAKAPRHFVLFVQKLVSNRRQMLLPVIAVEYQNLLDAAAGRVHARVTVSREYDEKAREALKASLTKALKKTVVAHITVDPRILGGLVVRVGDTVMDGSVRRRLTKLRDTLLRV